MARLVVVAFLPSLVWGMRQQEVFDNDGLEGALESGSGGLASGRRANCRMALEGSGFEVTAVVKMSKHRKKCDYTCSMINGFDLRNKIMPSFFTPERQGGLCRCFLKGSTRALFRYPGAKCSKKGCWSKYESVFNFKTHVVDVFRPGSLAYTCSVCEDEEECPAVAEIPAFATDLEDDGIEFAPTAPTSDGPLEPEEEEKEEDAAGHSIVISESVASDAEAAAKTSSADPEEPCGLRAVGGASKMLPAQCTVLPGLTGSEWQPALRQAGCRGNLMVLTVPQLGALESSVLLQADSQEQLHSDHGYVGLRVLDTNDLSDTPRRSVPTGLSIRATFGVSSRKGVRKTLSAWGDKAYAYLTGDTHADDDRPSVTVEHTRRKSVGLEILAQGHRVILPKVQKLVIRTNATEANPARLTLEYSRPPSFFKVFGRAMLKLGLKYVLPGSWVQKIRYHPIEHIDVTSLSDQALIPCADESVTSADEEDKAGTFTFDSMWDRSFNDAHEDPVDDLEDIEEDDLDGGDSDS